MDKNNLTPKQEKFCECVASGMNYTDAYCQAYNAGNMQSATVNVKACELLKNGKITVRINELKAKAEEKLIYSAVQSFDRLDRIGTEALADKNYSAALKAEELKGKLAGLYVDRVAQTDSKGNDLNPPIVSSKELLDIMERRNNERKRAQNSSD